MIIIIAITLDYYQILKSMKEDFIFARTSQQAKYTFDSSSRFLIFFFYEFVGTIMFAYINLGSTNYQNYYPSAVPGQQQQIAGITSFMLISLGLFILLSLIAAFSGAHFNPAVTFANMIRKTKPLSFVHALAYILGQISGAIIGSFMVYSVMDIWNAPITKYPLSTTQLMQIFGNEIFGTFILIFFILHSSEPLTTFCSNTFQCNVFVPTVVLIAREYSWRNNGLNPAFGIAFEMVWAIANNNWNVWSYIWVVLVGPLTGALIAVLFFQYFYKRIYYHLLVLDKNNKQLQIQEESTLRSDSF